MNEKCFLHLILSQNMTDEQFSITILHQTLGILILMLHKFFFLGGV